MPRKKRRTRFTQPTIVDPDAARPVRKRHRLSLGDYKASARTEISVSADTASPHSASSRDGSGASGKRPRSAKAKTKGPTAHRSESPPRPRLVAQEVLGAGGQGKVLKAFDPHLGRSVAMKVLAPRLLKAPASVRRFVEEARVMARLDHPNIIPVHDLVLEKGRAAHFVMKLVKGRTLESVALERLRYAGGGRGARTGRADASDRSKPANDQRGFVTLRDLLVSFLKVCDALAFAHDRHIIHCDLKPANIMLGEFGEAYLMDWGIAAQLSAGRSPQPPATAARPVHGTPDFMSPEQANGDPRGPTKRTDVFGLGAVLYFILTGRPPFGAKTSAAALARAKKCRYDDPDDVMTGAKPPAPLVSIVKKAMSFDPKDRFGSVLDLREQVDQVLRGDWALPTKSYPAGSVIVREGEWADAAYILMSGSCVVSKVVAGQRRVVRTLERGAVFGETAILSGDVRTATVESVEDVVVRVVTRELFHGQLGIDSWLSRFVLALADRFRELEQRLSPAEGGAVEPRANQR